MICREGWREIRTKTSRGIKMDAALDDHTQDFSRKSAHEALGSTSLEDTPTRAMGTPNATSANPTLPLPNSAAGSCACF